MSIFHPAILGRKQGIDRNGPDSHLLIQAEEHELNPGNESQNGFPYRKFLESSKVIELDSCRSL
jgi:hypothetical protein